MQKTLFCVQRHKTVQTDHIILHCILGRTSASCSLLSLNAQVIIPAYFKKSSPFFTFSYVSFVGRGHLPPEQPGQPEQGAPPACFRRRRPAHRSAAMSTAHQNTSRSRISRAQFRKKASGRKRMMGSVRQSKSQLVFPGKTKYGTPQRPAGSPGPPDRPP